MLFFGKKKTPELDLSWLNADMHSHLLPGIDDGSPDIQMSIRLIKGLHAFGYKKLITTPHILWDMYPNTTEKINSSFEELKKAVDAEQLDVELRAAAEYYVDEHFEDELRKKSPLLPVSGNMVLIEFSMVTAQIDLQQTLFELQIQNYQPIIAHPERYSYLLQRREYFDELKQAGCFLQLNLMALTGYYGKSVQELAEYLLKKNYYDFAGTDLHHERHLSALQKLAGSKLLEALKHSGTIKNHLL